MFDIILANARMHQIKGITAWKKWWKIAIFADVAILNLGKPTESTEKLKVRVQRDRYIPQKDI